MPASGAGGRWFESGRPHSLITKGMSLTERGFCLRLHTEFCFRLFPVLASRQASKLNQRGKRVLSLLAFRHMLMLIGFIASISVTSQTHIAYGHGCQAQGGCCTVGSTCVDISANSPIYIMFAVVGSGSVLMFAFYSKPEQRKRLGMIFNIFI
jgi:hypothetical protein